MRRCLTLLIIGAVVIAATIVYALIFGNFIPEAKMLLPLPWFHLSMVDLYLGFLLFGCWILYREDFLITAVCWIILLLILGNLVACIYAIIAMVRSRGNWTHFWLGDRMPDMTN